MQAILVFWAPDLTLDLSPDPDLLSIRLRFALGPWPLVCENLRTSQASVRKKPGPERVVARRRNEKTPRRLMLLGDVSAPGCGASHHQSDTPTALVTGDVGRLGCRQREELSTQLEV